MRGKLMSKMKIHYCWFGRNPKSTLIIKCMESWKKYCPNSEIIEWNEDNFDVNCCDYVREAYKSKKWAFVSDYCRFYVLYNYGGIYLDTDVELLKPIDGLPYNFVGFEDLCTVNSGLIRGAQKGDPICKMMLDSYLSSKFICQNGELNLLTVCERETDILCSLGMIANNTFQVVGNTTIYPTEYFNPTDLKTGRLSVTTNTISIHHYAASWVDKNSRFRGKLYKTIRRFFGESFAENIRKIVGRKNGNR